MSAIHKLKCHPGPFQAVLDGSKPFEFRKDDRDPKYDVGHVLWLEEWNPELHAVVVDVHGDKEARGVELEPRGYTGRDCRRTVTYIIRDGFGIPEGYCIMGLRSEPSGSVSEELIRAGDAMGHIANVCYGTHGHTNGSHDEITKAIRAWKRAKSSTPAVPSVEEIMEVVKQWIDPQGVLDGEEVESYDMDDLRARLTQALRSLAVDGRSGTNVPSLPSGVPSPETGGPLRALQAANAPAHCACGEQLHSDNETGICWNCKNEGALT